MDAKQVIAFAKEQGAQFIDLRFTDWPGTWQHCSYPISMLTEDVFSEGFGFDGSSIRGWQAINESDMLMLPDPSTAFIDPFFEHTTLVMTCDIGDPGNRDAKGRPQPYSRDPRNIAKKAVQHLRDSGIGDTAFIGPEAEFFIFNSVHYGTNPEGGFYSVDSREGNWNTGAEEGGANLGYKIRAQEGYFPTPPNDSLQDVRSAMCLALEKLGIEIEAHHHEVATAGQAEIDMKFTDLLTMADQVILYKYVVKQVAVQHGMTVTFMPKPLFEANGSGMHTHQSIWKGGKPLFAGDEYGGFSDLGLHYTGGVIKHSRALAALTNPTTNSYKRLTPGYEAPVTLAVSARNRSAACRIPTYSNSPKSKRIEIRYPDPACNPYLAFSAMLLAGLDGIRNQTDPGQPLDFNLFEATPEQLAQYTSMPATLEEALDALEQDHAFLLEGGVFTQDAIDEWISYKRQNEADQVRLRPHPHEFELYYDV